MPTRGKYKVRPGSERLGKLQSTFMSFDSNSEVCQAPDQIRDKTVKAWKRTGQVCSEWVNSGGERPKTEMKACFRTLCMGMGAEEEEEH